jgi:hypothetical protein
VHADRRLVVAVVAQPAGTARDAHRHSPARGARFI